MKGRALQNVTFFCLAQPLPSNRAILCSARRPKRWQADYVRTHRIVCRINFQRLCKNSLQNLSARPASAFAFCADAFVYALRCSRVWF